MNEENNESAIRPWVRIAILIVSVIVACTLSIILTDSIIPKNPKDALIFQNALLLIVLGSAVLEYKFTKPADSAVNSLIGIITLLTVYDISPIIAWNIVFYYCLLVFIFSTVCISVSSSKNIKGWKKNIADFTFKPSVIFGKSRVLFSILFLFGIFSFYEIQSTRTISYIIFWGLFISLWPLGIPGLLSKLTRKKTVELSVGKIIRTDWPNIVRAEVQPNVVWKYSNPKVYQQVDGRQSIVIPLYSQVQEEYLLGTGICIKETGSILDNLEVGYLYNHPSEEDFNDKDIAKLLGGTETSALVGFTVEDSSISQIKFETWDFEVCKEGMLVWCKVGDIKIFYQITEGITREESFKSDRHGYQIAIATQLGILNEERGFIKYGWLPPMNSPVFKEPISFGEKVKLVRDKEFSFGTIPETKLKIGGSLADNLEFHTAILGITGSGKTELAFDLIRYVIDQNVKVICIDLTAQYKNRLNELKPINLSLTNELSEELGKKLFDVDTGQYGAGSEKKILNEFSKKLREDIAKGIKNFLLSKDKKNSIGIVTLEEISNTKATLYLTELFLTCLLHFARDNSKKCPKVLIVVEEAHTVMPEPSTMGLGDYDSKGLVSKITQIALQGRKYGVGLLVIAQRTATVSKSVLTQCNTVISFTCFDDTSLKFLSNIYSDSHIKLIPNLPPLQAVVFGKSIRSERPIIVQIPYDKSKDPQGIFKNVTR
ncbi:MAG: ATP-binding protein [Ignavibacteria bacterium]|nr:ATP-binding protein [Ignavibacteria bacterium]